MSNYVVATIKSWNIDNFHAYKTRLPGEWHLITEPTSLTEERLEEINPEFIFFPHWSWIVPENITKKYQCVCFHMTDLPFGRGGSPLQNLISRGIKITKLSVLKMTQEVDAGPIYFKYPLTLDGSAEDILKRASLLSYDAIEALVTEPHSPKEQQGQVTPFKRRTPQESQVYPFDNLEAFYNHIRMLDAEGYPRAYLKLFDYKIEFAQAKLSGDKLSATAYISKQSHDENN